MSAHINLSSKSQRGNREAKKPKKPKKPLPPAQVPAGRGPQTP